MKMLLALILLTLTTAVQAEPPPVSAKGQSGTKLLPKWNLQVPYQSVTDLGGIDALIETGSNNLLENASFERTTTNTTFSPWTVTLGSASAESTEIHHGKKSLKLDFTSGTGTILDQSITPTVKLGGATLEHSIWLKGDLTTASVCALQAAVEAQCQSISAANTWGKYTFYLAAPSSGSVGLKIKRSSASGSVLYVDEGYVGLSRDSSVTPGPAIAVRATRSTTQAIASVTNTKVQFNTEVTDLGGIFDPSTNYRATVTVEGFYHVHGKLLMDFVTDQGNLQAIIYKNGSSLDYTLPSQKISATSGLVGVTYTAGLYLLVGDYIEIYVYSEAASTRNLYGDAQIGGASSFNMELIPGTGPGRTALNLATTAASWSGYHDSTCSWARTNASYGDPTADASCGFTETTNSNFGAVTSALSGSDKLPGIVFTPPRLGKIAVCSPSYAAPNVTAVGATLGLQLTDGTTVLSESVQNGLISTYYQGFLTCQQYVVTSLSALTIKLQSKASAGQITIGGNGGHAIEWSVFYIDQQFPAPLILNSVVGTASAVSSIMWGAVTTSVCSASPCTLNATYTQAGISSVTRSGTGAYTVNIGAGYCSAGLTCVANCSVTGVTGNCSVGADLGATASATTFSFSTYRSDTNAVADSTFRFQCTCTK